MSSGVSGWAGGGPPRRKQPPLGREPEAEGVWGSGRGQAGPSPTWLVGGSLRWGRATARVVWSLLWPAAVCALARAPLLLWCSCSA